jgi:hypothetical protein
MSAPVPVWMPAGQRPASGEMRVAAPFELGSCFDVGAVLPPGGDHTRELVPRQMCREAPGGAATDLVSTKTGGLTRAVAQASESIQRSRRRASRTMSSGWRNVFVSSMIPW